MYLCIQPLTQNFEIWRGNTYGEGACFTGSVTPHPKGVGSQRSPILVVTSIYAYTLSQKYQIWRGNTRGWRRVSCGQPRQPSQDSGIPALPNFGVLLYSCLHPLTQNDLIRHSKTYGEGRVLEGQPPRCICKNVSRGLSATAEFLV